MTGAQSANDNEAPTIDEGRTQVVIFIIIVLHFLSAAAPRS
jgi:hypothetical protein